MNEATLGQDEDAPVPRRARRWPVVAGVVAVLVALSLVAYLSGWFDPAPDRDEAEPSEETPVEDVEVDFDPDSADFFLPPDNRPYFLYGDKYPFDLDDRQPASEPVQLTDGAYYPEEGADGDDPHMRMAADAKPLYTDVSGDGMVDVVAVMEYTGKPDKPYTAWKGVFIWLAKDGELRPLERPAAWQWTGCPGETELTVEPDGLSRLPVVTRTGDGNCDGDKNDSQGENPPPQTVYVLDGVPVSVGHATSAVERCYFLNMYKKDADYTVSADVTPRLAPKNTAAEIDGTVLAPQAGGKVKATGERQTIDRIELRIGPKPDKKLYGGWVPVNIVWSGSTEPISCGWVNWADIGKKLDKE